MKVHKGDWISYNAELFRVKKKGFQKLYRPGYGVIIQRISDDLVLVFNGVRICLVHREDIMQKH